MKLPAIPGMEDFAGRVVPHRPLGLRLHRRRSRRAAHRSSATRSSASSAPAPPASSACRRWPRRPSTSTCSSARRRPSACGATGRPTPTFAEAPAARAGSRPGWTTSRRSCSGRPVDADLVDDGWTHHYAAVHHPPRCEGHDASRSTSAAPRSSTSGSWRSTAGGSRSSWPIPATAEILKPYYRYLCKRPCFHDEYLDGVQQPQRHARRLPRRHRAGHRARARSSTASSTRSTASSTAPGFEAELTPLHRRAGHEIVGRGGVTPGREVGRRRRQPLRDDEPRLPEPVRHAGARPAGGRHRQLHPARRARRRVRRPAPSRLLERAGRRRCSTSSAEAEERRGRRRSSTRSSTAAGHGRLHAVADQQRGQPGAR